jgi:dTDP-L-rhamnose 4-epimerase
MAKLDWSIMNEDILITGGAGFIGSHLADALLSQGHKVTVLDLLHPQVHGPEQHPPAYLQRDVTLVRGDVRDGRVLSAALAGKTVVYHFAAYTGVGQSMYQIHEYLDVNVGGTAVLLEQLIQNRGQVRKLILASSRAVYGEGAGYCPSCGMVNPPPRSLSQLRAGRWELVCPNGHTTIKPMPTPENKLLDPLSIYAISKQNQEQICRLMGETYDLPVVILRYFNVYGSRQSLKNPYTGVINAFITRLLNDKPPQVYEDGRESRDFVHVGDVVQACLLAMRLDKANGKTINVGSGQAATLLQVAQAVAQALDGPEPVITGQYRAGDIRHCHADLRQAETLLDYRPQVTLAEGLQELLNSIELQSIEDQTERAEQELITRGLAAKR